MELWNIMFVLSRGKTEVIWSFGTIQILLPWTFRGAGFRTGQNHGIHSLPCTLLLVGRRNTSYFNKFKVSLISLLFQKVVGGCLANWALVGTTGALHIEIQTTSSYLSGDQKLHDGTIIITFAFLYIILQFHRSNEMC